MNFTRYDMTILFTMSVAVVIMSLVFPMMGLSGNQQDTSDIPDFNITQSRFDFAGDFPQKSGRELEGFLNHSSTNLDDYDGQIQYEIGKNSGGNRTFLVAINETAVHIVDVKSSNILDVHNFTSTGEEITLAGGGFRIDVRSREITDHGLFEYDITRRPDTGGLFSFASDTAATIGWLVSVLFWPVAVIIELILNLLGIIFDITAFVINLAVWLTTTYNGVISGAPSSWAKVLVALPGLLLTLQFVKGIMLVVDIIWLG